MHECASEKRTKFSPANSRRCARKAERGSILFTAVARTRNRREWVHSCALVMPWAGGLCWVGSWVHGVCRCGCAVGMEDGADCYASGRGRGGEDARDVSGCEKPPPPTHPATPRRDSQVVVCKWFPCMCVFLCKSRRMARRLSTWSYSRLPSSAPPTTAFSDESYFLKHMGSVFVAEQ